MSIILREYQNNQLDFIKRKLPGKLPIAIESPTGSGKTIVILQFIKEYFEKHPENDFTIVLSTGFNKLVHQFAEEAKKFELKPIKWMGKACVSCKLRIMQIKKLKDLPGINDFEHFSPNREYWPKNINCFKTCKHYNECYYTESRLKLKSLGPKFIITNHSSYLIAINNNIFMPDIAFIDESHTFGSFYESYLKIEITKSEIEFIKNQLDNKDPTLILFKRCIEKGIKITPQLFRQIKRKLEGKKVNTEEIKLDLINRLERFSEEKPSIDKYIEVSNNGIEIIKFWSMYEVMQAQINYILFSATQDDFTLEMFDVLPSRLYIEEGCNTIDYSKSEFIVVPEEKFSDGLNKFLLRMKEKNRNKGLVLSTTMVDINYMENEKEIQGYKVFRDRDIDKFLKYKGNSILIGSRGLFQGIDIPDLNFVCLNRIPFPTYDDKFKAQANYLEKVARINAWRKFTIPQVKNDITQTTGRLWRKPGDKGTICIMDPRLTTRFKYMIKYIEEVRKGIKVEILE